MFVADGHKAVGPFLNLDGIKSGRGDPSRGNGVQFGRRIYYSI